VASSTAFSNSFDRRASVLAIFEARARRLFERDTGQTKIAQRVLDQRTRRPRQAGEIRAASNFAHRRIEFAILAKFGRVLGHLLQRLRVGGAQRFAVGHGMQVRHRRPGALEAAVENLLRLQHARKRTRARVGDDRVDRRTILGEHGFDRRQHLLGFDLRKRRQCGVGQQGIACRHIRSGFG
jgi:hypothetical protein